MVKNSERSVCKRKFGYEYPMYKQVIKESRLSDGRQKGHTLGMLLGLYLSDCRRDTRKLWCFKKIRGKMVAISDSQARQLKGSGG